MFNWTLPETHAISILKKDHEDVKKMFKEFEETKNAATRNSIIKKALAALKCHAVMEEEIFYPAVRGGLGGNVMNEADEEHHVAKVLIAELEGSANGHDHRDAKFHVLGEAIRHHIGEEENKMFPEAQELDLDFVAIGEKMLARKKELLKNGFPPDTEHKMVKKMRGVTDSPAANAKKFAKSGGADKWEIAAQMKASKEATLGHEGRTRI